MKHLIAALAVLLPLVAEAQIKTPGSGGSSTATFTPGGTLVPGILQYTPTTLTSPSNLCWINMAANSMQVTTLTNNTSVLLTNITVGANVSVMFLGPSTNTFNVILPATLRLYSGAITNAVTTNKSAVISFTAFSTNTADVVATVAIQP